jgi:hypothetical protein
VLWDSSAVPGPRFGSQLYFFQADFAEFFHPKESDDGNQLWGHVVKCLVDPFLAAGSALRTVPAL